MADATNKVQRDVLAGLLVDSVSQRFPDRFTTEQVEQLRQAIAPIVEMIATLRNYSLTNADEPDPSFRAYRGES